MIISHDPQSFVVRSQTRDENPGSGNHSTHTTTNKPPQAEWLPLHIFTEHSALDVAADYDLPLTPIIRGGNRNEL